MGGFAFGLPLNQLQGYLKEQHTHIGSSFDTFVSPPSSPPPPKKKNKNGKHKKGNSGKVPICHEIPSHRVLNPSPTLKPYWMPASVTSMPALHLQVEVGLSLGGPSGDGWLPFRFPLNTGKVQEKGSLRLEDMSKWEGRRPLKAWPQVGWWSADLLFEVAKGSTC